MEKRKLGSTGPFVACEGLGCMGMSPVYGQPDEQESLATIARAVDLGVELIDTSDMYGAGHNEEVVGRGIKGRRDRVILATKFGHVLGSDGHPVGVNGRPEYVQQACEASLRRLQVDVIDLYYQHRVDRAVPIEETVGAMGRLVEQGKVRYLGLSEASASTLRRAASAHPIVALQTEYSLWYRELEAELLPTCRELGVAYVAYAPLGRGLLTGRVRNLEELEEGDNRRNHPRFQGENLGVNLTLVDRVRSMAEEKSCSPAQLALAWVLAQGEDVIPIPGTKRRTFLEENIAAAKIRLSQEDLDRLDREIPVGAGAGTRYGAKGMAGVNV
ncbi:MAG TPA: aldo/keto reductase [Candidatus Acidoferrales bacterium]|nr:aldo/keto reductase [Candidatus Acidoferrales bacterium]